MVVLSPRPELCGMLEAGADIECCECGAVRQRGRPHGYVSPFDRLQKLDGSTYARSVDADEERRSA